MCGPHLAAGRQQLAHFACPAQPSLPAQLHSSCRSSGRYDSPCEYVSTATRPVRFCAQSAPRQQDGEGKRLSSLQQ